MNNLTLGWFEDTHAQKLPVSNKILQERATSYVQQLQLRNTLQAAVG